MRKFPAAHRSKPRMTSAGSAGLGAAVRGELRRQGHDDADITRMSAAGLLELLEGDESKQDCPPMTATGAVAPVTYDEPCDGGESLALLAVRDAARRAGCSEDTIRRAYASRELKVFRFGAGRVRIALGDLRAWLARGGPTRPVG